MEHKHYRVYQETLNEVLKDPLEAAAYLEVAAKEEDMDGFLIALRNIARAHGIL
jgi:DNA-binding phage protein